MKEPQTFNTQREAYWYRQGMIEALESVNTTIKSDLERYDLETIDHLPEGGADIEGIGKSDISSDLMLIRKFGFRKELEKE